MKTTYNRVREVKWTILKAEKDGFPSGGRVDRPHKHRSRPISAQDARPGITGPNRAPGWDKKAASHVLASSPRTLARSPRLRCASSSPESCPPPEPAPPSPRLPRDRVVGARVVCAAGLAGVLFFSISGGVIKEVGEAGQPQPGEGEERVGETRKEYNSVLGRDGPRPSAWKASEGCDLISFPCGPARLAAALRLLRSGRPLLPWPLRALSLSSAATSGRPPPSPYARSPPSCLRAVTSTHQVRPPLLLRSCCAKPLSKP